MSRLCARFFVSVPRFTEASSHTHLTCARFLILRAGCVGVSSARGWSYVWCGPGRWRRTHRTLSLTGGQDEHVSTTVRVCERGFKPARVSPPLTVTGWYICSWLVLCCTFLWTCVIAPSVCACPVCVPPSVCVSYACARVRFCVGRGGYTRPIALPAGWVGEVDLSLGTSIPSIPCPSIIHTCELVLEGLREAIPSCVSLRPSVPLADVCHELRLFEPTRGHLQCVHAHLF